MGVKYLLIFCDDYFNLICLNFSRILRIVSDQQIEIWSGSGAYQIAETYAFRGEIDEAFAWLEKAYEDRDSGLVSSLVDPLLSNLHDDPRWPDFLDKMGLPN